MFILYKLHVIFTTLAQITDEKRYNHERVKNTTESIIGTYRLVNLLRIVLNNYFAYSTRRHIPEAQPAPTYCQNITTDHDLLAELFMYF